MSKKEEIARLIMYSFWGNIPEGYDWENEAESLYVKITDTEETGITVMDLTNKILSLLK